MYAADETAVFLDSSNSLTIAEKGSKDVPVLTTGHDKLRITVMLTARNDGSKCKPFVFLPYKRPRKEVIKDFQNSLELCWEGTTWMNNDTCSLYLRRVLGNSLFGKILLVWDAFRAHTSTETKTVLKELRLDTAVIPSGCTKFLQAPDVSWNASFKAHIRRFYEDWMIQGEKLFTRGGKPAAPAVAVYLKWVADASRRPDQEIFQGMCYFDGPRRLRGSSNRLFQTQWPNSIRTHSAQTSSAHREQGKSSRFRPHRSCLSEFESWRRF